MASRLEELLSGIPEQQAKLSPVASIQFLAASKPLRMFIQSLVAMPESRFEEFCHHFRLIFKIAQNDILTTNDSGIITELRKHPHFVALFDKLGGL